MIKVLKISLAILTMIIASLLLAWLQIKLDLASHKILDGLIKIAVIIATIYAVKYIWQYPSNNKN